MKSPLLYIAFLILPVQEYSAEPFTTQEYSSEDSTEEYSPEYFPRRCNLKDSLDDPLTTLDCSNYGDGFRNYSMESWDFWKHRDGFLQGVKSLILTGNNYSVIPEYMFDSEGLEALDISRCRITKLSPQAFGNSSNIRSLSLAYNQLSNISDLDFRSLPFLNNLSLKSAFVDNLTKSRVGELYQLFRRSELPNLRWLNLENNDIVLLPVKFFCPMKSLRNISVSYNRIKTFNLDLTCLPDLQSFYIRSNFILSFKDNFPRQLKFNFRYDVELYLAGNELLCDCKFVPFLAANLEARRNSSTKLQIVDFDSLKCSPRSEKLSGSYIETLRLPDFEFCLKNFENSTVKGNFPEASSRISGFRNPNSLNLTIPQLLATIIVSTVVLNALIISVYIAYRRLVLHKRHLTPRMRYHSVPVLARKGVPGSRNIGSDAQLAELMRPSILNILHRMEESAV